MLVRDKEEAERWLQSIAHRLVRREPFTHDEINALLKLADYPRPFLFPFSIKDTITFDTIGRLVEVARTKLQETIEISNVIEMAKWKGVRRVARKT